MRSGGPVPPQGRSRSPAVGTRWAASSSATAEYLLDTRGLDRVLDFDAERGTIAVEAGIQWPALIEYLAQAQQGREQQWGIAQKQTGADRLSIGGAIAANVHGRGLTMKPLISDLESFVLVDGEGRAATCSRDENPDLFRLAAGGYGLFGCIYATTLRLVRRQKLERVVEVALIDDLIEKLDGAGRGRVPLRRLPVRDRRRLRRLPTPRSVLVLLAGAARRAAAGRAACVVTQ